MKSIEQNNKTNRKTSAEITKQKVENRNTEKVITKEVVIIYPNEENKDLTSEQLKSKVKNELNLKEIGNIGIKNIRKIGNNGIIIECNNRSECGKLEKNINQKIKHLCEAKIPNKKNPRVIIYNLFNDNQNQNKESLMQEIKESIVAQNETIKNHLSENEDDLICKYLIKSKNINHCHLVVEVSPKLRRIILELEKLNINWSRHSVKDFISITRCFNCLEFGHTKNNCNSETNCSNCGQSGHSHNDCNIKSQILC